MLRQLRWAYLSLIPAAVMVVGCAEESDPGRAVDSNSHLQNQSMDDSAAVYKPPTVIFQDSHAPTESQFPLGKAMGMADQVVLNLDAGKGRRGSSVIIGAVRGMGYVPVLLSLDAGRVGDNSPLQGVGPRCKSAVACEYLLSGNGLRDVSYQLSIVESKLASLVIQDNRVYLKASKALFDSDVSVTVLFQVNQDPPSKFSVLYRSDFEAPELFAEGNAQSGINSVQAKVYTPPKARF